MKEIGGYLELEHFGGQEYYLDLIAVSNARNALLYILKAKQIKKIYIPYYLCDSVSILCNRENYDYEYYHISEDFMPVFDKKLGEREYLYVVNYFGQLDDYRIKKLKEKHGNIILDNVQAFFQKPITGIDTVYSCRKFFGVPDGGYVSTDTMLKQALPIDMSKNRMKHILGRYESSASDFYNDFRENDDSFDGLELRTMSRLTHNILCAIDYESVIQKRNENYSVLAEELGDRNKLKPIMPQGPYAYPFYCENGMTIKKKLAEKKIFVATLWPNILEMDGTIEKDYAENILPLPCDQRYTNEDMLFVAEEVRKCISLEN